MRTIDVYSDGACSGNPGPGGIGVVIITPSDGIFRLSECYRYTTNNRMEVLAAARGLEKVAESCGTIAGDLVRVFTDSQIVYGTMAQGWRKKANQDLWARLEEAVVALTSRGVSIGFHKVEGHKGNPFNEEADRLATAAYYKPADAVEDTGYTGIAAEPVDDMNVDPFRKAVKEILDLCDQFDKNHPYNYGWPNEYFGKIRAVCEKVERENP